MSTEYPGNFPACVTTRSMARKAPYVNDVKVQTGNDCVQLAGTIFENLTDVSRENQIEKPAKNADVVKPFVLDRCLNIDQYLNIGIGLLVGRVNGICDEPLTPR